MTTVVTEELVLLQAAVASKSNIRERLNALLQLGRADSSAHLRYYPAIYINCGELGVEVELPASYRKAYLETWSRNRLILLRAQAVADYLAHRSVPTLLLKSTALMLRYGAPAGMRYMSDIDLMVEPENFPQAISLLQKDGWRASASETVQHDLSNHHSIDLIDPNGYRLDLHVRGQVWASKAFDAELWRNSRLLNQNDTGSPYVPDTQELF